MTPGLAISTSLLLFGGLTYFITKFCMDLSQILQRIDRLEKEIMRIDNQMRCDDK